MKDQFVVGTIAGMIAGEIKNITAIFLYKLGFTKFTMVHMAASVILKVPDLYTPLGYLTGAVGDLITGGLLGFLIILVLSWLGFDYWWYKGLIIGSAIWFFGFGLLLNFNITHLNPADDLSFRVIALFDHLL
jgi:hypothetical protein